MGVSLKIPTQNPKLDRQGQSRVNIHCAKGSFVLQHSCIGRVLPPGATLSEGENPWRPFSTVYYRGLASSHRTGTIPVQSLLHVMSSNGEQWSHSMHTHNVACWLCKEGRKEKACGATHTLQPAPLSLSISGYLRGHVEAGLWTPVGYCNQLWQAGC